ncbi:hypothetical protein B7453_11235 [Pseudomonas sp. IB20]|nr:hypothetical protein B7453_11235 [Pseudomonas sp. IB20]
MGAGLPAIAVAQLHGLWLNGRHRGQARFAVLMIVPTLCVGMRPVTLRVRSLKADAERPLRHSHAERGNERSLGFGVVIGF